VKLGLATIGQTPRSDLVPTIREHVGEAVDIVERGFLDDKSAGQIAALGPGSGETHLVTRLRDGSEVPLSRDGIVEEMQKVVESLDEEGADVIVVLCGHDWSKVKTRALIINPGMVFPSVVSALAKGRRLGIIKPSPSQIKKAEGQMNDWGVEDCIATSASPYIGEARLDAVKTAARKLREAEVDLVWMSCVGMDEEMRAVVLEEVGRPALLARSVISKIIAEAVSPLSVSAGA
jgi:protein AroM